MNLEKLEVAGAHDEPPDSFIDTWIAENVRGAQVVTANAVETMETSALDRLGLEVIELYVKDAPPTKRGAKRKRLKLVRENDTLPVESELADTVIVETARLDPPFLARLMSEAVRVARPHGRLMLLVAVSPRADGAALEGAVHELLRRCHVNWSSSASTPGDRDSPWSRASSMPTTRNQSSCGSSVSSRAPRYGLVSSSRSFEMLRRGSPDGIASRACSAESCAKRENWSKWSRATWLGSALRALSWKQSTTSSRSGWHCAPSWSRATWLPSALRALSWKQSTTSSRSGWRYAPSRSPTTAPVAGIGLGKLSGEHGTGADRQKETLTRPERALPAGSSN